MSCIDALRSGVLRAAGSTARVAAAAAIAWSAVAAAPSLAHAQPAVAEAPESGFTVEQAVAVALRRNRDIIAARLRIDAAELDRIAAAVHPNPTLSYAIGNLVIGAGNAGNARDGAPANPGFFEQPVQTVGIQQTLDVWAKRSARVRAAEKGIEVSRLEAEDAVRQIVRDVRSSFTEVLREQAERALSHEMRDRYADTVRLSKARREAGEISEAEFRKIELEGFRYQDRALDAEMQLDVARLNLAALLGLGGVGDLPETLAESAEPSEAGSLETLTGQALSARPDLRALRQARAQSEAAIAREHREVLPDVTVGLSYTHSNFLVSGDNPNGVGLSVSVPLPVFDRNRAGIGRAELDSKRIANEVARLEIQVRREVAEAFRRAQWARARLELFEQGGMLERSERALHVAERSYRAGAISLLELLEAERTYLETKAEYLRTRDERHRSLYDLLFALGSQPK